MKTTLLVLSYIAKVAGFVGAFNTIPGVDPKLAVLIFFAASLVKDTANRVDDFLTANFISGSADTIKKVGTPVVLVAVLLLGGSLTACAPTAGAARAGTNPAGTSAASSALNSLYTLANVIQTANTGEVSSLSDLDSLLTKTHNSGLATEINNDSVLATAADALFQDVVSTVKKAQAAGLGTSATQAQVNQTLAPAAVQQTLQQAQAAPTASYEIPNHTDRNLGCRESPGLAARTPGLIVAALSFKRSASLCEVSPCPQAATAIAAWGIPFAVHKHHVGDAMLGRRHVRVLFDDATGDVLLVDHSG